jgi:hypothetical protein
MILIGYGNIQYGRRKPVTGMAGVAFDGIHDSGGDTDYD